MTENFMNDTETTLEKSEWDDTGEIKVPPQGKKKGNVRFWTEDEDKWLVEYYPKIGINECARLLQRSKNAVRGRSKKLHVRQLREWTKEEDDYLKENFYKGFRECMKELNRTESAVRARAHNLGVTKKTNPWDESEIEYLKMNFKTLSYEQIANDLNRKFKQVIYKASMLDLHKHAKWTEKEEIFLLENYEKFKNKELGDILNRSEDCIYAKYYELTNGKRKKMPRFKQSEVERIVELYNSGVSPENMEAELKIDQGRIKKLLNNLGICRDRFEARSVESNALYKDKKFGKLTVIKFLEIKDDHTWWKCQCDCGNFIEVRGYVLTSESTQSCGCIKQAKPWEQPTWQGHGEISAVKWRSFQNNAACKAYENKRVFDITIEYAWEIFLKQERKCALTGIPLEFEIDLDTIEIGTASLDRINSDLGYICGNIQWVHKRMNSMKLELTDECFIRWCNKVSEYNANK